MPLQVGNRLQDSAKAIANQAKWEAANPTLLFEDLNMRAKYKIWHTGNVKLGRGDIWDWKWKGPASTFKKKLDGTIVYFGKKMVNKDGVKKPYTIEQKARETPSQFYKRVNASIAEGRQQGRITQTKNQIKIRKKIDAWSTKWLKDNVAEYRPREVNEFLDDFKKAWKKENAAQGYKRTSTFLPTHTSGFPSLFRSTLSIADQPFKFEGFAIDPGSPEIGFRKGFFKNKVLDKTKPLFKQKLDEYFEYILKNKSGLNNQFKQTGKLPGGMGDVVYWMSPDSLGTPPSGVFGVARTAMFRGLGKEYEKKFRAYIDKTNRSNRDRHKYFEQLEKKLKLSKGSVATMMRKEGDALKKLFDVKQLPPEFHGFNLGYSVEHTQGLAAALRSNNMNLIRQAHKDLAGMSSARNLELGWLSSFEKMRGEYIRDIEAGLKEGTDVTKNLNKLNKMVSGEYRSWGGVPKEIYNIKNNMLKTSRISTATTPKQRFAQYFAELAVNPMGARALAYKMKESSELLDFIKKSPGNILMTIGKTLKCPVAGAAEGGRIGLATGTSLINCISSKVENDPIGSSQKIANIDDTAPGLTKIKNAATGFLNFAKKGGKFGAIAAGGAAAAGLVKTFMNDDPSTYLSNEDQQKNMLIDMVTSPLDDTPQESPAVLDYQLPTLGAVTAAGMVPGGKRVYDVRRRGGVFPTAEGTKVLKPAGPVRSALGLKGVLGKGLAATATPLGLLALEPLHLAGQIQSGDSLTDVATNPLNYLGPTFAAPLTKEATRFASPMVSKIMRMGMSPTALKGLSRFGGLGLAASLGIQGVMKYDDWRNKRGWFSDE